MSTRAMIGYMSPEGSVTGIYSHWDGYPTGVGYNLMKFYGNPRRVIHLIDGGDVSQIDWNTGHANHYAFRSRWVNWNPVDKCYTNEWDRGGLDEKWEDVKPRLYEDMNQYLDESLSGKSMICYAYLFDYSGGDTDHSQLSKGRWRCFKSDYGSGKIFEVELDEKKLRKSREKNGGDVKDKIVGEIKIGKVA
jgi:hypothetical protein|tara:strand:+ start:497 stop:1069 length:573 start_codon:yes stop_codon:yes gene_type:complete